MSLKFGMDWKKHDAKRVMGMMVAMNVAAEMPKKKRSKANGRDEFR